MRTGRHNFTPLQSRRLPHAVLEASLCPSMDLIALSLGGAGWVPGTVTSDLDAGGVATSVVVHRTVSWQKLLSVHKSVLSSQVNTWEEDGEVSGLDEGGSLAALAAEERDETSSAPPSGASALCWSPDGRTVALGLADGGLALFDVEASAEGGVGKGGSGGGALGGSGIGAARFVPPVPFVAPIPSRGGAGAVASAGESEGALTDAADGERKDPPLKLYTTSPAMTRSRAAAMRRQKILKAAGSKSDKVRRGESEAKAESCEKTSLVVTESSDVPDLGWRRGCVAGLVWARIGPKHRLWELDEEEEEKEEFWRHRSHYLDRSKYFLPPCDYSPRPENDENQPPHHDNSIVVDDTGFTNLDKTRPTSSTPLSVLCVSTCANGLHLYLHGRYRLLSIPPAISIYDVATNMVCTSDLGAILLSSKTTSPSGHRLALYSIPPLSQNRYDLQQISALYCSLTAHLQIMRKGIASASASWKGALRPLDVKFEALAKLLRNYGVLDASTASDTAASAAGVRAQLLCFALEGHSLQNGDMSNAMDQFFAAATMNDQLLVRMERTLEANVAGVEGTLRKSVLGPVRSLVHDVHELRGLASAMGSGRTRVWEDSDSDDDDSCVGCVPLLDVQATQSLCGAVEILFEVIEQCISMLVDARFRLRDVMKWIRGTASQVKARGTAIDSVMRENARKRRVPDSVIKRVAVFLSSDPVLTSGKRAKRNESLQNSNMTEQVLGVPLSTFFSDTPSGAVPLTSQQQKQTGFMDKHNLCSALSALSTSSHLAADLFDQPRNAIAETVERIDIIQSHAGKGSDNQHSYSVHRRVGAGISINASTDSKFFSPNVDQSDRVNVSRERHWTVVAYSGSSGAPTFTGFIHLVAIPTGRSYGRPPQFFLLSSILLPKDVTVSDLHFYGDDGCSSLSSAIDAHEHEEGRQALGVLTERIAVKENADNLLIHSVLEELWILSYDDLPFKSLTCETKSIKIPEVEFGSSYRITTAEDDTLIVHDAENRMCNAVNIKRRQIRERAILPDKNGSTAIVDRPLRKSRLVLSGSRGIGGVVSSHPNSLELFDLEEDEGSDENTEQSRSSDDNCNKSMST